MDDALAKRTLRSVTIRLVPLLMAQYFANYLDRTNLGIAKAEISADLQLSATMFGLASGIFFIGCVLVEEPFMLAIPIVAAVGTPLATWLIQTGHGVLGLAGWRFMAICVGLPAVILGVICWFYRTAPSPNGSSENGEYPRSQPGG